MDRSNQEEKAEEAVEAANPKARDQPRNSQSRTEVRRTKNLGHSHPLLLLERTGISASSSGSPSLPISNGSLVDFEKPETKDAFSLATENFVSLKFPSDFSSSELLFGFENCGVVFELLLRLLPPLSLRG